MYTYLMSNTTTQQKESTMLSMLPIIALLSALGPTAPHAAKTTAPTVRVDSARGLPDYEAQHALETDPAEITAPTVRPLSALPAAAPVQLARLEIQAPARASTRHTGLDCPE